MVAATYDQGDAAGMPMPVMGPLWGSSMETLRLSGETKGTEFSSGVKRCRFPWEDSAVTDKGSQRTFFQLLTDKCLIFGKADGFSQRFRVKIPVKKPCEHRPEENRRGFFPVRES